MNKAILKKIWLPAILCFTMISFLLPFPMTCYGEDVPCSFRVDVSPYQVNIESGGEDLAKAKFLIENMDSSIKELDIALKQINSKKGTVGKLIYDEKLYDNVTNAAASLDSLLVDFRKNPGKYVKVSVF